MVTLLTKDEVAKLVRCHPAHVYRLAKRKDIPEPIRVGGRRLWEQQTLLDHIGVTSPDSKSEEVEHVG